MNVLKVVINKFFSKREWVIFSGFHKRDQSTRFYFKGGFTSQCFGGYISLLYLWPALTATVWCSYNISLLFWSLEEGSLQDPLSKISKSCSHENRFWSPTVSDWLTYFYLLQDKKWHNTESKSSSEACHKLVCMNMPFFVHKQKLPEQFITTCIDRKIRYIPWDLLPFLNKRSKYLLIFFGSTCYVSHFGGLNDPVTQ